MQTGRQYRAAIPRGMPADEAWSRQSPMRLRGFVNGKIIFPGVPIVWEFGPTTQAVYDPMVTGFTWIGQTVGGVGVYDLTLTLRPIGAVPGYVVGLTAIPHTIEPGGATIEAIWVPPTPHSFLDGIGVFDFTGETGTASDPFVFPCTFGVQAVTYHDEP